MKGKVYEKVRVYLQDFIKNNPAGTKLPTYQDLNKQIGAKQSAVERVLQEFTFQGLIDRIPRKGIYISASAKKSYIGVVFGYGILEPIASPFWSQLMLSLRSEILQRGLQAKTYIENYDLINYKDLKEASRELISDLESDRLQGVIVGQYGVYSGLLQDSMVETQKPAISLFVKVPGADCLNIDIVKILYDGIDVLIKKGCRRICVISHDFVRNGSQAQLKFSNEVLAYLKSRGCTDDERYFSLFDAKDVIRKTHQESGEEMFRLIMSKLSPDEYPDGIVIADDMITRGVLPLLADYDLKMGRNIHVASLVNKGSPTLMGYEENMIRVEVDPIKVARLMVEAIIERLNGRQEAKDIVYVHSIVEPPNA